MPALIFAVVVILLPPTKAFKKSLFYSLIDKNKLFAETPLPRIIFIGGSNLSFGLDSKRIKDSLNINPINTSFHGSIGLKYMLANSINYIKENDIVVISPEYQQFYGGFANGEIELLSIIIEIAPQTIKFLDSKQKLKMVGLIPDFITSKFKKLLKDDLNDSIIGIYDRKSFNSYGDAYKHWNLPKEKVKPYLAITGKLDEDVFSSLLNFREIVYSKKAKLYITFPCYQDLSFKNSSIRIKEVEQKLKKCGFILLSNPERYIFPDSLIFNTPYHLTLKGADLRTSLLIEDLKKVI